MTIQQLIKGKTYPCDLELGNDDLILLIIISTLSSHVQSSKNSMILFLR